MLIVAISDTHNKHRGLDLPAGDVLVHCGDALGRGTRSEFLEFINWFGTRPYRHKIYVPGNHDFYVEEDFATAQILCIEKGIHLLVDRPLVIDGVKFYGAPWVPNLEMWAFYQDHIGLLSKFRKIPDDTDVLITHTPPAGIRANLGSIHLGSQELRERVDGLNLKLHLFGHIHDSYGVHVGRYTSINAANCNEDYQLVNAPMEFDLKAAECCGKGPYGG